MDVVVGGVLALIVFWAVARVALAQQKIIEELRLQATQNRNEIAALRKVVDRIADRVLLTREQRRIKWFDDLPEVDLDRLKSLSQGGEAELILATGLSEEVVGLHYRHERLEFRTVGEKDVVAHGLARPWATIEDRPVKIYLNQYTKVAKIFGLDQDGTVKLAPHGGGLPD